MRKFIAAALLAAMIGAAPVASASAKGSVDCTVFIYQPQNFFLRGPWRPKTMPHGWTTEDWFYYCSGRFRPEKKSPNRSPGHWGVNITLNIKNCTYTADEAWLRERSGWKNARIYISPYPVGG
jgi:hypothetical protein